MARIRGGKTTVIYDTTKRQPLDSRMLVTKVTDLINPESWITNSHTTDALFNGLIVAVNSKDEHRGIYYLTDRTLITEDNYTAYQTALINGENTDSYFTMWVKLAEGTGMSADFEVVVDGGEITE